MRPHAISMWAFARYASVPIRTGPTRVGGCVPARFSADKSHTVVRSIRNSIRALARMGCARDEVGILVVGACIRGTPSVRFADSSLGEDSLSPLRGQLPRGGSLLEIGRLGNDFECQNNSLVVFRPVRSPIGVGGFIVIPSIRTITSQSIFYHIEGPFTREFLGLFTTRA